MKKWQGSVVLVVLFTTLILRYVIFDSPLAEESLRYALHDNTTSQLHLMDVPYPPVRQNPQNFTEIVSTESFASNLSVTFNISDQDLHLLHTWNHLKHLIDNAESLPQGVEAIKEAGVAWGKLVFAIEDEKLSASGNASVQEKEKEEQCPYSIRKMSASGFGDQNFLLKIPCGLIQGSSITIIGTPGGLQGNFRIELAGTAVPGEQDPSIMLHYNVRLLGDQVTEDPVIVQNTWTSTGDWGSEERCPSDSEDSAKVDDLERCNAIAGKDEKPLSHKLYLNVSKASQTRNESAEPRRFFPFKQGYLAIAILRVGVEGIHMTVDGKHVTSFAFRENLEPWFAGEVRVSGDIKLLSVIASGLPTSEDLKHVIDLEMLKAPPVPADRAVDLLIGIFSTANNFKNRMAVRRTWMQYDAVRSGKVAVRFFVGLHKTQMVNEDLWNEAQTYGDIQLMPFIDYYSLIPWKSIAICIYGTNVLSAKYIMKTDDDAFVRVDEILSSLERANVTHGLLYGRINSNSKPQRDPNSKWYITHEEWPEDNYPLWAHGPGYVISSDIAKQVYKQHKRKSLKMFKLEDVAMGIWINEMKKIGLDVQYVNEDRVYSDGCEEGYVVAHYQEPKEMLCLWDKLQTTKRARCCGE